MLIELLVLGFCCSVALAAAMALWYNGSLTSEGEDAMLRGARGWRRILSLSLINWPLCLSAARRKSKNMNYAIIILARPVYEYERISQRDFLPFLTAFINSYQLQVRLRYSRVGWENTNSYKSSIFFSLGPYSVQSTRKIKGKGLQKWKSIAETSTSMFNDITW